MKFLFVISMVALLALLWASVSIAQHVRRARRRKRRPANDSNSEAGVLTLTSAAPEKPAEEHRSTAPPPPPSAEINNGERADWAYFNKDMGDLRDPYQERRSKPRVPSGQ